MQLSRGARLLGALTLAGALGLTACGSKDNTPAATGDPVTTTSTAGAGASTIAVSGVDYAYTGLPAEVAAGSTLTFTNASKKEAHELVLVRVNDGETRSVQDLLKLPDAEAQKVTTVKGVSVAPEPGGAGTVVNGKLVVDEPGRYIALCFIQVGSDPMAMMEAMKAGKEPAQDPKAGPPHFTKGMVQEFTVK